MTASENGWWNASAIRIKRQQRMIAELLRANLDLQRDIELLQVVNGEQLALIAERTTERDKARAMVAGLIDMEQEGSDD